MAQFKSNLLYLGLLCDTKEQLIELWLMMATSERTLIQQPDWLQEALEET